MLAIGSVVYLKNGLQKIMVINRFPLVTMDEGDLLYDYSGSVYPMGFSDQNLYYFNQENIKEVVFEGYSNEEDEKFLEIQGDWIRNNGDSFKKGDIN